MPKTFKDEVEAILLNFLAGVKQSFRQDELDKATAAILAAADKLIPEEKHLNLDGMSPNENIAASREYGWNLAIKLIRERLGK